MTQTQHRCLDLREPQWALLEQMLTVLKPLQMATTALCESQVVSVSLVYPVINGLLKKHLVVNGTDLPAVKAFKENVSAEITCRFIPNSINIVNKPPLLAAAVDPRYKQLKFLNTTQRTCVYETIKEKISEIKTREEGPELEATLQKRVDYFNPKFWVKTPATPVTQVLGKYTQSISGIKKTFLFSGCKYH